MIYLKYFILYSIIGFYFESWIFKISNSSHHSGVLVGPYTIVYGIGGTLCLIINEYFSFNLIISYILFTVICTITELLTGHLINKIFHIDSWNYSNHRYHLGKYICLSYALIWGIMAILFIKYLKPFFSIIISFITGYIINIILLIMISDFLITLLKRNYTSL